MTTAIIGDGHFGVRSGDLAFLEFQCKWWVDTINKIADMGIKTIAQVGDLFDNRKVLDVRVAQYFLDRVVNALELRGVKMIITVGNHNIYYRESNQIHNLFFLKDHPNIRIVQESVEIDNVLFLGWINKSNQEAQMKKVAESSMSYCFAHLEPVDMPMYKGLVATHGMDMAPFKKFKKVYSGHYHTISREGNIVMVGSPYHLTWADYPDGINRGWFELDTVTGSEVFHPNTVDQSLFCIFNHNPEEKYHEVDMKVLKGKIARVVVNDKGETRAFNKFISLLAAAGAIEYKIIDNTAIKPDQSKTGIDPAKMLVNVAGVISDYTFELAGTVAGADAHKVKDMTINIYNKAITENK